MSMQATAEMAADLRLTAYRLLETADQLETAGRQTRRALNFGRAEFSDEALASCAARLYAVRRSRDGLLPAELLGEPAWDMLLDLFLSKSRGNAVSVTSASIAANVPSTTALRWISILENRGWVESSRLPGDNRVRIISLSSSGEAAMRHVLIAILNRERGVRSGSFVNEAYLIEASTAKADN